MFSKPVTDSLKMTGNSSSDRFLVLLTISVFPWKKAEWMLEKVERIVRPRRIILMMLRTGLCEKDMAQWLNASVCSDSTLIQFYIKVSPISGGINHVLC